MGQADPQKTLLEDTLSALLPQSRLKHARTLDEAVHYAVFPGGKRLRPTLTLMGARIFDGNWAEAFPAACAVEFVHTSSLIFDDLPCMDDATMRRNIPALHKVFGEEIALLAGLALLNRAYSLFGRQAHLLAEASRCIGVDGMIGGQALDLSLLPDADEVEAERSLKLQERNRKTSAMMQLAFTAGALACGRSPAEVAPLSQAGQFLGEAYQIGDDLLDNGSLSRHTGKTTGQDCRHGRLSHGKVDVSLCLSQADALIEQARRLLRSSYGSARSAEFIAAVDLMFDALLASATNVC